MNLILSFVHVNKPAKTVGPYQSVELDASAVRDGAKHDVLAVHREHQWEVRGVRYHRLDSSSRLRIHFEGGRREPAAASRRFGPFDRFSAVDGVAYTDDRVFAYVDAGDGDWFCYEDGRRWRIMVLTDAAGGGSAKVLAMLAALAPLLPGVLGLWQGANLRYLGRAKSIRAQLRRLRLPRRVRRARRLRAAAAGSASCAAAGRRSRA